MFVLPQQENDSLVPKARSGGFLSISCIGEWGGRAEKNQLSFCVLLGLHLLLTSAGGRWEEGVPPPHYVSYIEIGVMSSSTAWLLQRKVVERTAVIKVCGEDIISAPKYF